MTASSARHGPFSELRAVAAVGMVYAVAAAVWIAFGADLPGGRWFAVHLFTLGVVTNLILGLSDHFGRTLTHRPGRVPRWQLPAANASIGLVLWGVPNVADVAIAVGTTALSGVVFASYLRLRGLRRAAVGARFAWIVRAYERAHGAFLNGAVLGALVGAGVLAGRWWVTGRLAHLHVNLLGWAGVTLLATVVFFGPTIARVQIRPGADARAHRALRVGATAINLAVLALLVSALEGSLGVALRIAAAAGIAVFAWSVAVVCGSVAASARRARRDTDRASVLAFATWFPLVAIADVVVVAFGRWEYLDVVGVAMLLGVLGQAILGSVGYLAPFLVGGAPDDVRRALAVTARPRAALWNVGVVALVLAAIPDLSDAAVGVVASRIGWAAVLTAAVMTAVAVLVGRLRSPRAAAGSGASGS